MLSVIFTFTYIFHDFCFVYITIACYFCGIANILDVIIGRLR